MTTKEAFRQLVTTKGINTSLGTSPGAIRRYRFSIRNGKYPSQDLMDELLLKAGYTVIQEKQWETPKN